MVFSDRRRRKWGNGERDGEKVLAGIGWYGINTRAGGKWDILSADSEGHYRGAWHKVG